MPLSRNSQIGATVVAVGLAAAAGAFAATKLRHHDQATASALRPGFVATPHRFDRFGGAALLFRRGDDLATAASYLGLSQQELLRQLRSGKTLAQIADSTSGKSTAGLVDALVKGTQEQLAEAVKAGRLTQDEANAIAHDLRARITARVNGTFRMPHFGGPPGFWQHGGRGPTI
jgi:hypothetical protein